MTTTTPEALTALLEQLDGFSKHTRDEYLHELTGRSRDAIEDLAAENAKKDAEIVRMRAANGILEDGLQEVGDDYPGSSCQEWCQHQIKQARTALETDDV